MLDRHAYAALIDQRIIRERVALGWIHPQQAAVIGMLVKLTVQCLKVGLPRFCFVLEVDAHKVCDPACAALASLVDCSQPLIALVGKLSSELLLEGPANSFMLALNAIVPGP